jgi:N-acetyl-alpha-D-muramate 1-phosphate uridylyltransferase
VTAGAAPRTALLFAAGLGTRMRPLTAGTAKPLLPLGGRPLIDHALDRLAEAGVARVVVNAHWQAEGVAAHLAARGGAPETVLLAEDRLLDTGGTLALALERGLLGPDPFFVVNGDAAWFDGPVAALDRLRSGFAPGLDALLLLVRASAVSAEINRGDFMLDPAGGLRRPDPHEIAPFVYGGVQLAIPAFCAGAGAPPFSINPLWDRAIAAGRAAAIVHDGLWFHLSTPRDLAEAEQALAEFT